MNPDYPCHENKERLTAHLLNELSPAEAELVQRHLASCDDCRALSRNIELTLDLLRDALAVKNTETPRLEETRRQQTFGPLKYHNIVATHPKWQRT